MAYTPQQGFAVIDIDHTSKLGEARKTIQEATQR